MSTTRPSSRALAALLLVPLCSVAGCGPKRTTETPDTGPVPVASVGDTSSIATGGGKSIETMLAGRFPGVEVLPSTSGGIMIRIRGGSNSFYSGTEPLYVLDDVPLPQGTGGVVMVNPYDIQRIEVLKNPADVAVYGIRGANGVIKITTKRPGRH
jgi:TonB-dependent SusC/RagA subfamily outer membrane receptor